MDNIAAKIVEIVEIVKFNIAGIAKNFLLKYHNVKMINYSNLKNCSNLKNFISEIIKTLLEKVYRRDHFKVIKN